MAGANGAAARKSLRRWCALTTCASIEVAKARLFVTSADFTSETACFALAKRPAGVRAVIACDRCSRMFWWIVSAH